MRDSSGPALVLSGYRGGDSTYYQGSYGFYWSSMAYGDYVYYLTLISSNVYPADSGYKYYGLSIRCVAIITGFTNARSYPVSLVLSGIYHWQYGGLYSQGTGAAWWSSLPASSATSSYYLNVVPDSLEPRFVNSKVIGFPLRRLH